MWHKDNVTGVGFVSNMLCPGIIEGGQVDTTSVFLARPTWLASYSPPQLIFFILTQIITLLQNHNKKSLNHIKNND